MEAGWSPWEGRPDYKASDYKLITIIIIIEVIIVIVIVILIVVTIVIIIMITILIIKIVIKHIITCMIILPRASLTIMAANNYHQYYDYYKAWL